MELKNATLVTLLITLLAIKPVGSARDKGTEPLPAPPTLQLMEDRLASSSWSEEIRQVSHEPSTGEKTSSVPVKGKDPIASIPGAPSFKVAVQRGQLEAAKRVFDCGNNELKKYCAKHLISLDISRLVELIHRTSDYYIKQWVLRVFLVNADQPLLDKVFGEINLPTYLLIPVAFNTDLACMPRRFIYLLGKINDKQKVEKAVEAGVRVLFSTNRIECLDPLLNALDGEAFPNRGLENVAIRGAFRIAFGYSDGRALFVKRFLDHPRSLPRSTLMLCAILTNVEARLRSSFTGC